MGRSTEFYHLYQNLQTTPEWQNELSDDEKATIKKEALDIHTKLVKKEVDKQEPTFMDNLRVEEKLPNKVDLGEQFKPLPPAAELPVELSSPTVEAQVKSRIAQQTPETLTQGAPVGALSKVQSYLKENRDVVGPYTKAAGGALGMLSGGGMGTAGGPVGQAIGGAMGGAQGVDIAQKLLEATGIEEPPPPMFPAKENPSPMYQAGAQLERNVAPILSTFSQIKNPAYLLADIIAKTGIGTRQAMEQGKPLSEALPGAALENVGPAAVFHGLGKVTTPIAKAMAPFLPEAVTALIKNVPGIAAAGMEAPAVGKAIGEFSAAPNQTEALNKLSDLVPPLTNASMFLGGEHNPADEARQALENRPLPARKVAPPVEPLPKVPEDPELTKLLFDHEPFIQSIEKMGEGGASPEEIKAAFDRKIQNIPDQFSDYRGALEKMRDEAVKSVSTEPTGEAPPPNEPPPPAEPPAPKPDIQTKLEAMSPTELLIEAGKKGVEVSNPGTTSENQDWRGRLKKPEQIIREVMAKDNVQYAGPEPAPAELPPTAANLEINRGGIGKATAIEPKPGVSAGLEKTITRPIPEAPQPTETPVTVPEPAKQPGEPMELTGSQKASKKVERLLSKVQREAPTPVKNITPPDQRGPLKSVEYVIANGLSKALSHGVDLIKRGISAFPEWSRNVISRFGESVKGHITKLWQAANYQYQKQFGGTVGRRGAIGTLNMDNIPKEEKPSRSREDLVPGLRSAAMDAAESLPENRTMTGKEVFALMKKTPGLKEAELKETGLMDVLNNPAAKLKKQDVIDHLEANKIKVKEVVKGIEPKGLTAKLNDAEDEWDIFRDGNILENNFISTEEAPTDQSAVFQYIKQKTGDTKYSDYQQPGGNYYRELLLTMPPSPKAESVPNFSTYAKAKGYTEDQVDKMWNSDDPFFKEWQKKNLQMGQPLNPEFKSTHFYEPNILAHVRFNERTDAEGKKVLFLEEVQSDWAQKGRKEGFDNTTKLNWTSNSKGDISAITNGTSYIIEKTKKGDFKVYVNGDTQEFFPKIEDAKNWANERENEVGDNKIPNMPFRDTPQWTKLALSRMIRWASENGFDKIAWTTGEQQAKRYDLSKQISRVTYDVNSGGIGKAPEEIGPGMLSAYDLNRKKVISQRIDDVSKIEDYIGKDAAKKLIEQAGTPINEAGIGTHRREISGIDLKVGGEGMKAFYDKIVPNVMNDIAKKYGGRVDPSGNSIDLPQALKSEAMARGLPLYSVEHVLAKYAAKGIKKAAQFAIDAMKAGKVYAQYAIEAVKQFGEKIKPHLRAMWEDAKGLLKSRQGGINLRDKLGFSPNTGEPDAAQRVKLTFMEKARQYVQHQLLPVEKAQRILSEGKELPEEQDTILAADESKARVANNMEHFEKEHLTPLFDAIHQKDINLPEFEQFLIARHAPERNLHVSTINPKFNVMEKGKGVVRKGSGMDNAQSSLLMQKWKSEGKLERFQELAKKIDAITQVQRQALVSYGLITPDQAKAMEKFKYYVPLKGKPNLVDWTLRDQTPTGQGFDQATAPIKRTLGRWSQASDIIAHLIEQTDATFIRGEKNLVANTFLNFVEAHPDKSLWEVNKAETKPVFVDDIQEVVDMPDFGAKFEENHIVARRNGEEHVIILKDKDMAEGLKNLGAKSSAIPKLLMGITQMMGATRTRLNPEFSLSNTFRDGGEAFMNIVGDHGIEKAKDVLKSIPGAITGVWSHLNGNHSGEWESDIQEFKKLGGPTGYFVFNSPEQRARNIRAKVEAMSGRGGFVPKDASLESLAYSYEYTKERLKAMANEEGALPAGMRAAEGMANLVANMGEASELGNRVAVFREMKKIMSPRRAAQYAKNVTINFDRQGLGGGLVKALYMFGNAGIQGTARVFQNLSHLNEDTEHGRNIRKVVMGAIAASAAADMINSQISDEWDKMDQKFKNTNFTIMIPGTGGYKLMIPLPYGYSPLHVLGSQLSAALRGKVGMTDVLKNVTSSAFDAFNPIGGDSDPRMAWVPSVMKAPVEWYANKNEFFKRKIAPEQPSFGPSKPNSELFWKDTSPSLKAISKALNSISGGNAARPGKIDISPATLEYFADFVFGGMGQFARRTAELGSNIVQGKKPELNTVPFVRRLVGGPNNRYEDQAFRDNTAELLTYKAESKIKAANPAEAWKLSLANSQLLKDTRKYISEAEDMITKLRSKGDDQRAAEIQKQIVQRKKAFNDKFNSMAKSKK